MLLYVAVELAGGELLVGAADAHVVQQILVLRQGKLVQSGRHEVLSKTDGVYKKMWDAYTDAFRWQLDTKEKRA